MTEYFPPYTGDASNSEAILTTNTSLSNANLSYIAIAEFNPFDNALLAASVSMVDERNTPDILDATQYGYVLTPKSDPNDDPSAAIRSGDYIELLGGRLVRANPVPCEDSRTHRSRQTVLRSQ